MNTEEKLLYPPLFLNGFQNGSTMHSIWFDIAKEGKIILWTVPGSINIPVMIPFKKPTMAHLLDNQKSTKYTFKSILDWAERLLLL